MSDTRALAAAKAAVTDGYTEGPWRWFGNSDYHMLYLATINQGRRYVMKFGRWGTGNAEPWFGVKGLMKKARDLITFDVDESGIVGVDAAKAEGSGIYRRDISGINHPDAKLIEAAWTIPALVDAADTLATRLAAVELERDALREGLESMCWQFGSRGKHGGRLCLGTMGLSALEEAFDALGWPDPKPIPEMECEIEGCYNEQGTFYIHPDGQHINHYGQHYKNVCWACNTALLGKETPDGQ